MKQMFLFLLMLICAVDISGAQPQLIEKAVDNAVRQTELMVSATDTFSDIPSPRTIAADGRSTHYTTLEDWTSGFYPGTLWYLYELTGDAKWRESAVKYTEGMEHIKNLTSHHDIGFMMYCSFGNALRLTGNSAYGDVLIASARSLATRYRPEAGVIQSWNKSAKWECPVIIDNMMNLELLFEATRMSGDSTFWKIAVSHANKTMDNHYRADMSSFHVVDYDPITGAVLNQQTAQGYADSSAWSRGQAWGLYGYTLCYRYTRDPRYLEQAEKIAAFIFNHPNMPSDMVPYWDYDAPRDPAMGRYPNVGKVEPRDASAAAVTASAMYELSTFVTQNGEKYKKLADKILTSLTSPEYTAPIGENGNFILMHSVGSIPHNTEIDVPLVYADYYLLEALKRKRDLEQHPRRTCARLVPERYDDWAWENDMVAWRMYGPALEATGEVSGGIDVWCKRTRELVMDRWYAAGDYHTDHGEGLDGYKVGRTLGAGAMAPVVGDTLCFGRNFVSCALLDSGSVRTAFRAEYAPLMIGTNSIREERTISLDAGSRFNDISVVFRASNNSSLTTAAGFPLRESSRVITMPSAILISEDTDNGNGTTYLALIAAAPFKVDTVSGHVVALFESKCNTPCRYMVGAGWSRDGIQNAEQWRQIVAKQLDKLTSPLLVSIK